MSQILEKMERTIEKIALKRGRKGGNFIRHLKSIKIVKCLKRYSIVKAYLRSIGTRFQSPAPEETAGVVMHACNPICVDIEMGAPEGLLASSSS